MVPLTLLGTLAMLLCPCLSQDNSTYQSILLKYGYVPLPETNSHSGQMNPDEFAEGIKKYQGFNGLPETGVLDGATQKLMGTSRCGNKDIEDVDKDKLYNFLTITRWNKKKLSWIIRKFSRTSKLSKGDQIRIITRALKYWSDASGLTFKMVQPGDLAELTFSFEDTHHGDGYNFDGRGNVFAHAFPPYSGDYHGQIHFDDKESWTQKTSSGTNLLFVAVHELGHALGLDHSKEPHSIMAPTSPGYISNLKLHNDDIAGIRKLYGEPPSTTTKDTTTKSITSTLSSSSHKMGKTSKEKMRKWRSKMENKEKEKLKDRQRKAGKKKKCQRRRKSY